MVKEPDNDNYWRKIYMIWQKLYNDRIKRMSPSIIQEMRDLVSRPGTVSFTAGEPSEDLFPLEELKSSFEKVFNESPDLLSYAPPAGDPQLRSWISNWLYEKGYTVQKVEPERILLTNGSQAALSLVSLMFFNSGTGIVLEDPSYTEAMLAFGKEGCNMMTVEMDAEGPLPDSYERVVKQNRPSFFYTIPTFQNPSGFSTSEHRKQKILEISETYGVVIIEDDPYRELWFDVPPPLTYMSLSPKSSGIFYLGSFSKIIAPGMRCGFAVLPEEVMKKAVELRVLMEIGLSSLVQRALWEFLVNTDMEGYLHELRNVYRKRRDSMVDSMKKHLEPRGFRFAVPGGGFFVWGNLPGIDCTDFAKYAAREEKVGCIPGSGFFVDPSDGREFLRFSFAQVDRKGSEEGMLRLSRALDKYPSSKG